MKMNRKLAALLAGTQLLLVLSACDSSNTTTSESSQTGNDSTDTSTSDTVIASTVAKTEFDLESMTDVFLETAGFTGDTVIATAGDMEITVGEVLGMTLNDLDTYAMYAMYGMGEMPWGQDSGDGEIYEDYLLRTAVELATLYRLFPTLAQEEGITLDDNYREETQAYLESVLIDLGGSEEAYQYVLWRACTTEEMYVGNSEATAYITQLKDLYFGEKGTLLPTEDELLEEMEALGMYKAKHILLSTMDDYGADIDDDAKAEVLANAEAILAELQSSEDLENDFHTLMLEHSEDPGSTSQPEGYTATKGQMVEPFEVASLALEVGGLSGIVESVFGYHIIYRLPLEADASYMDTVISAKSLALQDQWLSEYPIVTNEVYDNLDVKIFYENLTILRDELQYVIAELVEPAEGTTEDASEEDASEDAE